MAKEPANEGSHLMLVDRQHDQAITPVAQRWSVEAGIACEECAALEIAQQDDDLFVLEAFAAQVHSDLPDGPSPRFELETLTFENIFV